jgi:hypothetical protein
MTSMIPLEAVGAALGRVALGLKAATEGVISTKIGSVLETKIAGRLWTGLQDAKPIFDRATGAVTGLKNALETRIYRAAEIKPPGHFHAG